MNHRNPRMSVGCWSLAICLCIATARAEFPTSRPYATITYEQIVRIAPVMAAYVVKVDLTDPKVNVRVCAGGDDPDGAGPWETTLMPVTKIAERAKLAVAVNASYFGMPSKTPIPEELAEKSGKPSTIDPTVAGYREGRWANDNGVTIADGRHWSIKKGTERAPTVWVGADHHVHLTAGTEVAKDAVAAVSGNVFVLQDGEVVPEKANAAQRHPRTVVGIDQTGQTLVIMAVDGRMISSIGMTGTDMGNEMKRLGCWTAINLDGGGSTTLVMRDPSDSSYHIINKPSDGHERPVADVLGVSVGE